MSPRFAWKMQLQQYCTFWRCKLAEEAMSNTTCLIALLLRCRKISSCDTECFIKTSCGNKSWRLLALYGNDRNKLVSPWALPRCDAAWSACKFWTPVMIMKCYVFTDVFIYIRRIKIQKSTHLKPGEWDNKQGTRILQHISPLIPYFRKKMLTESSILQIPILIIVS